MQMVCVRDLRGFLGGKGRGRKGGPAVLPAAFGREPNLKVCKASAEGATAARKMGAGAANFEAGFGVFFGQNREAVFPPLFKARKSLLQRRRKRLQNAHAGSTIPGSQSPVLTTTVPALNLPPQNSCCAMLCESRKLRTKIPLNPVFGVVLLAPAGGV